MLCVICGPTTVMIASGNEMSMPMLSWWPFVLWATEEFARTQKRIYLCVITVSLCFSLLAQQLQIFAIMAIFYLFYLLIIILEIQPKKRMIIFREILISGLAALLISCIQILPTLELAALSNRVRSYSVANSDPLKLHALLTLIFPPILYFGKNNWQHFVLYFGFLPLFSSIIALKAGRRMILYGLFTLILILMSLGLPIYWLFYNFFPFGKFMNGGEELTFALAIIIPIMAGVGWNMISIFCKSIWLKRIMFLLIIVECVVWGEIFYKNVEQVPNQQIYKAEETHIADIIKKKLILWEDL